MSVHLTRMLQARRGHARHEVPDLMRQDVRLLGELLGKVLREAGGDDLLADVEQLRELTIKAYDGDSDESFAEAEALISGFSQQRAEEVAKAFTCYFHLVNLAEEYHRVRIMHDREADLAPHQLSPDDSLPAAFEQLSREVGRDEALRRLSELEFRPVFTAHPTEARRRAVSSCIQRISALIAERSEKQLGGTTLAENTRRLLAEIDTLWRTSPLRSHKPSPLDEVRSVLSVFDSTLFEVLPQVYRRLDDWLQADHAGEAEPLVPAFVQLGSWIGGDRDGNPNVTPEITREAMQLASDHLLVALEAAARQVGAALTINGDTTPASGELEGLWRKQRQMSEKLTAQIAQDSPNEPYRRVLLVIAERISATRLRDADLAYGRVEELESDLEIIQQSLIAAGAKRSAYGDLQRLIWQVRTFGFHLVEIEIRQHSQVHSETLAEIAEKGVDGDLSPRSQEVLEVFRSLAWVQKRFGQRAARRYIVSFTQESKHLAQVFELAELAMGDPEDVPVIDAIPLFETFDDLVRSVDMLDEALQIPQIQRRLEETGRRLEVMLGYSDSSKDVGPVGATLALHDAQSRIAQWAERNNITLTLFHGRGGALGRGGGPANRALLAQPPGSVDGRFKLTEQGEVIFARYGNPEIAGRHIEQVAGATLLASAPSTENRNSEATAKFAQMAAKMDVSSRERFYELVKSEGFPQWFAQVTPLEEIGLLPIGSRPARRGLSVSSLDDLRAIPWVFSWSQARTNLAGWFGLGTALAAVDDVAELRAAYQEWPLFATLIDNIEMSIAKTDERIIRRYFDLGDRDDLAALVLEELALTREGILKITGSEWMLTSRRVLGRAVQLRGPYIDALSLLQLRALRGLRKENPSQEEVADLQQLLLLTVNGVSAGLQNTG